MTLDRASIDERYSCATQSNHLQVKTTRCDVDYLVAAGWSGDALGSKLYRLAVEWDRASGDYKLALRHIRSMEDQIDQISRNLAHGKMAPHEATGLAEHSSALIVEARREAITARTLALTHLKSLASTREGVVDAARSMSDQWMAKRRRSPRKERELQHVCSKALMLWLDSTCPACSGRGFISGGLGQAKQLCHECGSTGRAHYALHRKEKFAEFVVALLAYMDRRASDAEASMRRWLMNG